MANKVSPSYLYLELRDNAIRLDAKKTLELHEPTMKQSMYSLPPLAMAAESEVDHWTYPLQRWWETRQVNRESEDWKDWGCGS